MAGPEPGCNGRTIQACRTGSDKLPTSNSGSWFREEPAAQHLERRLSRAPPNLVAIADDAQLSSLDLTVDRRGDPDGADRLFRRASSRAGDPGNRQCARRAQALS